MQMKCKGKGSSTDFTDFHRYNVTTYKPQKQYEECSMSTLYRRPSASSADKAPQDFSVQICEICG